MTANPFSSLGISGNLIEWVNPNDGATTWDWVNVYASATSAWSGATLVASGIRDGQFIHNVTGTRYYWVRAERNGVESLREPNSDTSSRVATPPPAQSLANFLPYNYAGWENISSADLNIKVAPEIDFSVQTSIVWFGEQALQIQYPNAAMLGGVDFVYIGKNKTDYIRIPEGRKLLFVCQLYPDATVQGDSDIRFQPFMSKQNGTGSPASIIPAEIDFTTFTANQWTQKAWLFDWTGRDVTLFNMLLAARVLSAPGSTANLYVDACMLLDVTDDPVLEALADYIA
jgi:hypothetical protein